MGKEKNIQQLFLVSSIITIVQSVITIVGLLGIGGLLMGESMFAGVNLLLVSIFLGGGMLAVALFLLKMSKSSLETMRENPTKIILSGVVILLGFNIFSIIASVLVFAGYFMMSKTE